MDAQGDELERQAESGTLDEAGNSDPAVIHSERRRKPCWRNRGDDRKRPRTPRKEIEPGARTSFPSQERHDETLKEKIRLRFYSGMFSSRSTDPSSRVASR